MTADQHDGDSARFSDQTTRFGDYTLGTRPFSLSRDGEAIEAPRQSLELLDYLIARRDRVATRQELIERFWSTDHLGADQNLNTCVRRLRKALGEDAARLIETHARVGYRFVGRVDEGEPERARPAPPARLSKAFLSRAAAVAALGLTLAGAWAAAGPAPSRAVAAAPTAVEIAVPPGRNMCETTLFPMFAEGLRENLLADLQATAGDEVSFLKVGAPAAGGEAPAPYVLDLGIRQMPDRTIANLSLVSAADGKVLWSRQITEPTNVDNYLATQERLSSRLAEAFAADRL
jgi:DNA-binding winged helix-turn-helix (wHTH) protein/TolB-like protein